MRRASSLALLLTLALAACSSDDASDGADARAGSDAALADTGASPPFDAGSEETQAPAPAQIVLDVPFVVQKPELPRGCEVTSLAMLLQEAGVSSAAADKMKLAAAIDKVPYMQNGLYGNPNTGFVGDMYTLSKSGYGVYHAPVARLAATFLPGRIVDLTGTTFDVVLADHVGRGRPVLVVINAKFEKLPAASFTTWKTATGDVQITWEEHAVVITGYDPSSVVINNPLAATKNQKLDRTKFREAWEQMGQQAITTTR